MRNHHHHLHHHHTHLNTHIYLLSPPAHLPACVRLDLIVVAFPLIPGRRLQQDQVYEQQEQARRQQEQLVR